MVILNEGDLPGNGIRGHDTAAESPSRISDAAPQSARSRGRSPLVNFGAERGEGKHELIADLSNRPLPVLAHPLGSMEFRSLRPSGAAPAVPAMSEKPAQTGSRHNGANHADDVVKGDCSDDTKEQERAREEEQLQSGGIASIIRHTCAAAAITRPGGRRRAIGLNCQRARSFAGGYRGEPGSGSGRKGP